MIRVGVVAASTLARKGIESLLSSSDQILVDQEHPDVLLILTDRFTPDAQWPAPVVLLTEDPQPAWIAEALRNGARAVLPADASPVELVAAIQAVAAGLVVLPAHDAQPLLASSDDSRAVESLTPRETEILRMLSAGLSNKEIAARLEVSEHTVKFHVASILAKLQAGSRTAAVITGLRMGLIPL